LGRRDEIGSQSRYIERSIHPPINELNKVKDQKHFPPPNSNALSASSIAEIEPTVKNLLSSAVKVKREAGDLYPSLLIKQCCEFYSNLSMDGKASFLYILGRDFGYIYIFYYFSAFLLI
jgi:hypothetical protein